MSRTQINPIVVRNNKNQINLLLNNNYNLKNKYIYTLREEMLIKQNCYLIFENFYNFDINKIYIIKLYNNLNIYCDLLINIENIKEIFQYQNNVIENILFQHPKNSNLKLFKYLKTVKYLRGFQKKKKITKHLLFTNKIVNINFLKYNKFQYTIFNNNLNYKNNLKKLFEIYFKFIINNNNINKNLLQNFIFFDKFLILYKNIQQYLYNISSKKNILFLINKNNFNLFLKMYDNTLSLNTITKINSKLNFKYYIKNYYINILFKLLINYYLIKNKKNKLFNNYNIYLIQTIFNLYFQNFSKMKFIKNQNFTNYFLKGIFVLKNNFKSINSYFNLKYFKLKNLSKNQYLFNNLVNDSNKNLSLNLVSNKLNILMQNHKHIVQYFNIYKPILFKFQLKSKKLNKSKTIRLNKMFLIKHLKIKKHFYKFIIIKKIYKNKINMKKLKKNTISKLNNYKKILYFFKKGDLINKNINLNYLKRNLNLTLEFKNISTKNKNKDIKNIESIKSIENIENIENTEYIKNNILINNNNYIDSLTLKGIFAKKPVKTYYPFYQFNWLLFDLKREISKLLIDFSLFKNPFLFSLLLYQFKYDIKNSFSFFKTLKTHKIIFQKFIKLNKFSKNNKKLQIKLKQIKNNKEFLIVSNLLKQIKQKDILNFYYYSKFLNKNGFLKNKFFIKSLNYVIKKENIFEIFLQKFNIYNKYFKTTNNIFLFKKFNNNNNLNILKINYKVQSNFKIQIFFNINKNLNFKIISNFSKNILKTLNDFKYLKLNKKNYNYIIKNTNKNKIYLKNNLKIILKHFFLNLNSIIKTQKYFFSYNQYIFSKKLYLSILKKYIKTQLFENLEITSLFQFKIFSKEFKSIPLVLKRNKQNIKNKNNLKKFSQKQILNNKILKLFNIYFISSKIFLKKRKFLIHFKTNKLNKFKKIKFKKLKKHSKFIKDFDRDFNIINDKKFLLLNFSSYFFRLKKNQTKKQLYLNHYKFSSFTFISLFKFNFIYNFLNLKNIMILQTKYLKNNYIFNKSFFYVFYNIYQNLCKNIKITYFVKNILRLSFKHIKKSLKNKTFINFNFLYNKIIINKCLKFNNKKTIKLILINQLKFLKLINILTNFNKLKIFYGDFSNLNFIKNNKFSKDFLDFKYNKYLQNNISTLNFSIFFENLLYPLFNNYLNLKYKKQIIKILLNFEQIFKIYKYKTGIFIYKKYKYKTNYSKLLISNLNVLKYKKEKNINIFFSNNKTSSFFKNDDILEDFQLFFSTFEKFKPYNYFRKPVISPAKLHENFHVKSLSYVKNSLSLKKTPYKPFSKNANNFYILNNIYTLYSFLCIYFYQKFLLKHILIKNNLKKFYIFRNITNNKFKYIKYLLLNNYILIYKNLSNMLSNLNRNSSNIFLKSFNSNLTFSKNSTIYFYENLIINFYKYGILYNNVDEYLNLFLLSISKFSNLKKQFFSTFQLEKENFNYFQLKFNKMYILNNYFLNFFKNINKCSTFIINIFNYQNNFKIQHLNLSIKNKNLTLNLNFLQLFEQLFYKYYYFYVLFKNNTNTKLQIILIKNKLLKFIKKYKLNINYFENYNEFNKFKYIYNFNLFLQYLCFINIHYIINNNNLLFYNNNHIINLNFFSNFLDYILKKSNYLNFLYYKLSYKNSNLNKILGLYILLYKYSLNSKIFGINVILKYLYQHFLNMITDNTFYKYSKLKNILYLLENIFDDFLKLSVNSIKGFKLYIKGRTSNTTLRKKKYIIQKGILNLNTLTTKIDYDQFIIKGKYGNICIKLLISSNFIN